MDTLNHQLFTSTEKLPKKMLPQEHYGEMCMDHFTGRLTDFRQTVLTVGKEREVDIYIFVPVAKFSAPLQYRLTPIL